MQLATKKFVSGGIAVTGFLILYYGRIRPSARARHMKQTEQEVKTLMEKKENYLDNK